MLAAAISEGITERSVEVGNASVTFYDSGESQTHKPPVVLVHGTGGSTVAHYPFLLPMLAGEQRVVSVDLADPKTDADLELADLEAQVAAVLAVVGAPVCLVGYSLGAVVAASIAGSRPDLVQNLVLIAGWMRTDPQQQLRNDIWRTLNDSDPITAQQFSVFTAFSGPFLGMRSPVELERIIAAVKSSEFMNQQMALNRRVDITAAVESIRAATLVIGCRDDFMVPARHSRALFGAIADARYVEIGSGHAVVAERPAELVHLIATFNAQPHRHPAGSVVPSVTP